MKSVASSCRNTVADEIYASWLLTGWEPLAMKESECIMLKLNNSTSFTFHSYPYHYHHAGFCLHYHHQEAALVTASTIVFS